MRGGLAAILAALAGAFSLSAAADVVLRGEFVQGGLIVGTAPKGTRLTLDGRELRVAPDGHFAFGFGRDHPAEARLAIVAPGGEEQRRLAIARRRYDIQRIDGLPSAMVAPPPALVERIKREAERIAAARKTDRGDTAFARGFIWPVKGPISGVYGSQRILNGEPRQPHFGVDVAAPTGTPVVAPQAGEVTFAETDIYLTGGTVILDHGHGISSTFSHLAAVEVRVGQRLAQGERLGTVGATGRVTGAHLDWRLNWFAERLDPQLVVPPME